MIAAASSSTCPARHCPTPTPRHPPRILAPFDNVLLAHADRSRIISPAHRALVSRDRLMRTFLIDGAVAGTWSLTDGQLELAPFARLRAPDRGALLSEAERQATFAGYRSVKLI
jgi:hypothetical protein